jgi:hypothetical protein
MKLQGLLVTLCAQKGFVSSFDGKTLKGWTLVGGEGPGYVVKDGLLVCPKEAGGNLFTEKEYSNFVFRFEFRTEPAGNNGVGIRAPRTRFLWRTRNETWPPRTQLPLPPFSCLGLFERNI